MREAVTVACCQTLPRVGDPRLSIERARAALASALEAGAQIVVLPELATSGYVFGSIEEARAAAVPADGELLRSLARQAERARAVVVCGFCELGAGGRVFNSAAVLDGGEAIAVYRKLHLWNEEPLWFTPGAAPAPVVATSHGRIGVGICYDIEFPELTRGLALAGAELIALPTNWPREPGGAGGEPMLELLARTTAYLSRVHVAVCDRGGEERGVRFQGGSVIAAADGTPLARAARERAAPGGASLLLAECTLAAAGDKRNGPRNDAFADRRPEHYLPALAGPLATVAQPGAGPRTDRHNRSSCDRRHC